MLYEVITEDRLRHLVGTERIDSTLAQALAARCNERVVGDGERELRHHKDLQRLSGKVHTFPQALNPEQDGPAVCPEALAHASYNFV